MKKVGNAIWKWIRRHLFLVIVLVLVLYQVIGMLAPFVSYAEVSDSFAESFDADEVLASEESSDRAMILETNTSAWEERIRLLEMAEESIVYCTHDLRDGESTRDLFAMFLAKADEGVQVEIIVDGLAAFLRMTGRPLYTALSSHPNIEVRVYNPIRIWMPWTYNGRLHEKYMIVDDTAYILGGRNTFDDFLGDYVTEGANYDREFLIYNESGEEDSSLYDLRDYFESVWDLDVCFTYRDDESLSEKEAVAEQIALLEERYETLQEENPELFEEYDYTEVTVETEGVYLISGETGIYEKEPQVFYQLVELMEEADERIIINTPYAVLNDSMYEALTQLCDGDVEVSMMLNSIENGSNVVASSDYLKNQDQILDTGVTLYEYCGGNSYHGKSIVIDDDISIIGSFNFDLRSAYIDTELMLVVKSEEITQELTGYMEDLQNDSRLVLGDGEYETPEDLEVEELTTAKGILVNVLSVVMTPIRFLI